MNRIHAGIHQKKRIVIPLLIFSIAFLLTIAYLTSNANPLTELKGDYRFIRDVPAKVLSDIDKHKAPAHEVSPLGFTANSLLTIYQTFISSQDNKVCNFSPSCSHFARDAINRAGFIKGSLMAADRLLRCHPYSVGKYPVDTKTGKAADPVSSYLDKHDE